MVGEQVEPRAIAMLQGKPQRGERPADLAELAASLNLRRSDLVEHLPAEVVSTGAAHLLVQAKSPSFTEALVS